MTVQAAPGSETHSESRRTLPASPVEGSEPSAHRRNIDSSEGAKAPTPPERGERRFGSTPARVVEVVIGGSRSSLRIIDVRPLGTDGIGAVCWFVDQVAYRRIDFSPLAYRGRRRALQVRSGRSVRPAP